MDDDSAKYFRGLETLGKMFGCATYFAASATKSDDYTEERASPLHQTAQRTLMVDEVRRGGRLLPGLLVESHTQGKYQFFLGSGTKKGSSRAWLRIRVMMEAKVCTEDDN